jgi:DNA-binding beta-propeller fold protein YncE
MAEDTDGSPGMPEPWICTACRAFSSLPAAGNSCPACGAAALISLESAEGQRLFRHRGYGRPRPADGQAPADMLQPSSAAFLYLISGLALIFTLLAFGAMRHWPALQLAPKELPVTVKAALTLGGTGKEPGKLQSPRGLAVGPQGDLYVADLGNSRISVFGPTGAFMFSFGSLGIAGKSKPGQFNEPSGLAVGPDGTVYVADAWNHRIQEFDAKGRPKGGLGGLSWSFYSPRDLGLDRQGNVYVADTGNSEIKIADRGGHLLARLGGRGSGLGKFREVFGVAVNSKGEIFVADPGNKKIQKFSPTPGSLALKERWVPGWKNGVFWPQLAVDKNDLVYAADNQGHKIWVYDSELNYRATLTPAPESAVLGFPMGLAFGPDGSLWVGDSQNNTVTRLEPFQVPPAP